MLLIVFLCLILNVFMLLESSIPQSTKCFPFQLFHLTQKQSNQTPFIEFISIGIIFLETIALYIMTF